MKKKDKNGDGVDNKNNFNGGGDGEKKKEEEMERRYNFKHKISCEEVQELATAIIKAIIEAKDQHMDASYIRLMLKTMPPLSLPEPPVSELDAAAVRWRRARTRAAKKKKDKTSGGDEDDNEEGDGKNYCRRFGVPWTKDEHGQFLLGLQKLGRDWSGISRNYVRTRTPTQVASHAHIYFLRQFHIGRQRRRRHLEARQRWRALEALRNVIPITNKTGRVSLLQEAVEYFNALDLKVQAMNQITDILRAHGGGGGDEDKSDGDGGDDGHNGGGGGGGGGSGGNNKKESRDRDGHGNGDKHIHDDGRADTKGKNMDFNGKAVFGYRYGYHAGYKNGYPVKQLKCWYHAGYENGYPIGQLKCARKVY